jgi:5-methylcytosine-specific restriction endonuclease McrA
MQKLDGREETNTPVNAPQVHGNCGTVVKYDCGIGQVLRNKETLSNVSDVDRSRYRGSSDLRVQNVVYILNMRGEPLMPTRQQKANKLLACGKAKVIRRNPFTVQLTQTSGETRQNTVLGIDSGYGTVGFSVVSDKKELISGEIALRKDVTKKIMERRVYRRNRRGRLWHRKARFMNRGKEEGWLAPTLCHKIELHYNLIKLLKKLLPIDRIVIETANFDTQRMRNPEIEGVAYQQGELAGYETREYLLEKFKRACAYCGKDDVPLEVEHIVPRSRDGSDRIDNLAIACRQCNLDKGNRTAEEYGHPEIMQRVKESLKAIPFMNLVRNRIAEKLHCETTYGFETKYNRIRLGLEKSHVNDAFVIAGGNSQMRCISYTVKQVRRNNRSLQTNRRGHMPSIRRQRYALQPNDSVRFEGVTFIVKGVNSYGKNIRTVDENGGVKYIKTESVELICHGKGLQFKQI